MLRTKVTKFINSNVFVQSLQRLKMFSDAEYICLSLLKTVRVEVTAKSFLILELTVMTFSSWFKHYNVNVKYNNTFRTLTKNL